MKGYIYTLYAGADPGYGWTLNDPIFEPVPTLGACVPNIRRHVVEGDFIFAISGRVQNVRQFVVGGMEVSEKIDALTAYQRFPEYRVRPGESGAVTGNVIIDSTGQQSPLDSHSNFESRIENYIVGRNPVYLKAEQEIQRGRDETLDFLSFLFNKRGNRVFDIIGRQRKLDEAQVNEMVAWMQSLKQ